MSVIDALPKNLLPALHPTKQSESHVFVSLDTETERIGIDNEVPNVVCATLSDGNDRWLIASCDPNFNETIQSLLTNDRVCLLLANAKFDMLVLCKYNEDWIPLIFEKYHKGLVIDVQIAEKLMNLADFGNLETVMVKGTSTKRILYALSELEKKYLGIDRSASKEEGEHGWRLNFHRLKGVPSSQYPLAAREYALEDADGTLGVWLAQLQRADELGRELGLPEGQNVLQVLSFRCFSDFSLAWITAMGMKVNPEHSELVRKRYMDPGGLLHRDCYPLLMNQGILVPGHNGKPHSRGTKDHQEECPGHSEHQEYKKGKKIVCDCPVKMTAPKKDSISEKTLHAYIQACAQCDERIQVEYTDKKRIRCDKDWMSRFAVFDDILKEFQEYGSHRKMVSSYLNKLWWDVDAEDGTITKVPVTAIRGDYNILVSTGRTSCKGSDLYPSWNAQQAAPEIRNVVVPPEGYAIGSTDYNGLELVTLAQICLYRFGFSKLADLLNSGGDAHAYLGARLSYLFDSDFRAACDHNKISEQDDIYNYFLLYKKGTDDQRAFFKKYRTLAKPIGLGAPGGLGAATMVAFAWSTYKVEMTVEQAKEFIAIWKDLYPEMKLFFKHMTSKMVDTRNGPVRFIDKKTNKPRLTDVYKYTTPLGMVRSGANYCSSANGGALQSPGCEGALLGSVAVIRECYDTAKDSVLCGRVVPIAFVHDELVYLIRLDDRMDECVERLESLMCAGLQQVTPDVKVGVESVLMDKYWDKYADPEFDKVTGKLRVTVQRPLAEVVAEKEAKRANTEDEAV